MIYLDTLNHVVDVPQEVDGVSTAKAAAVVLIALCLVLAATVACTTRRVGTAAS